MAEVARRTFAEKFGPGQKLKPKQMLFCLDIKNCRDLRTFGRPWAKKCFFGQIECLLGKKCTITSV